MPTALITGGTAGLGLAFARRLAAEGYDLVLVARNGDRLNQVADEIGTGHGVAVEVITADLAHPVSRAEVERRLSHRGPAAVDLLVNNAGFEADTQFAAADPEDLQAEVDLNVSAVLQLTRAVVPLMIESASGAVVNVASFAGYLPAHGSTYGASKAWVLAFTDTLVASLAGTGVAAVALCAGRIRSAAAGGRWGPLWLDADEVVIQCLADLRRGRAISTPGWLYRMLVGILELPRRSLRRLARLVRSIAQAALDIRPPLDLPFRRLNGRRAVPPALRGVLRPRRDRHPRGPTG